jgi:hypothetical protein
MGEDEGLGAGNGHSNHNSNADIRVSKKGRQAVKLSLCTRWRHIGGERYSFWTADGGTVVKVLRYKSEGRWFDSRWCHWNFLLT